MAEDAARDLADLGVAVVEVMQEDSRAHWNDLLFAAMDDFPEYRVRGRGVQRVLGGFGALGNPSSFHHPTVRAFRALLKRLAVQPVLRAYARARYGDAARLVRLEALFDRLCVRCRAFKSPSKESWHRDIYDAETFRLRALPRSLPGGELDVLVGGWTNLDHRPQSFVGLAGSHDEAFHDAGAGFATFSTADVARHRFDARLAGQADRRLGRTVRCNAQGEIVVPPGHAILFLQRLVHAVKGGLQPETPALRVFHGFRLTTEEAALFDHEGVLANGAVPRIPSGQIPPMYSQNHYAAFSGADPRWRAWGGATFRRECLFRRTTPAGLEYETPGSRDDRNRAANAGRYMPSLAEMGLFDEERFRYSREEAASLHPQPLFA